jgi:hypothetical protein
MPFRNKALAGVALFTLIRAPAFADGTPGKPVNRGPAPVEAHQPIPPEPGCYLIEDGAAWSCPALPAPTPVQQSAAARCCGTITRTLVKEHKPVVTKRSVTYRAAPVTRTVQHRNTYIPRQAAAPAGLHIDTASFSGGVGAGIDGGFHGGGGAVVIVSSDRSYSGVRSHPASRFTFVRNRSGE